MNSQCKPTFVNTRQHERFVEFCEACRLNRYLGICTGRSGVGKTSSAYMYSNWHAFAPLLEPHRQNNPPEKFYDCRTAIYTPDVACTLKRVESGIARLRNRFDTLVQDSCFWYQRDQWSESQRLRFLELLIIDESHRLSLKCLEFIRDWSLKHSIGVVFLGRPGFEFRLRHHDFIGNKISFFHVYNTPRTEELKSIFEARWQHQAVSIEHGAVELIEKITSSNIQKLININAELTRVCELNSVTIITPELVTEASRTLLYDPR